MRILLIDDHALFRIGLQELLQRREIEVVGAVGDGYEGLEIIPEHTPDVVLLDMRMPKIGGLELLRMIRERHPQQSVVMLTTSREEQDVLSTLQSGAQGYLLKDMEPDDLLNALEEIVAGKTVVANELSAILVKAVQGGTDSEPATDRFSDLTPREREILCLLAEGQSNKVIGRNLGISDGTVKLHVKAILRKLEVKSRVEAAVMAVEQKACDREV